jgi:hypothetical protein
MASFYYASGIGWGLPNLKNCKNYVFMCELYTIVEINQIAPHILFLLINWEEENHNFASTQIYLFI